MIHFKNQTGVIVGKSYISLIRILFQLGLGSIIQVLLYRFKISYGLHRAQNISAVFDLKPIFNEKSFISTEKNWNVKTIRDFEDIKSFVFPFATTSYAIEENHPKWHYNYFDQKESSDLNIDWWQISDFNKSLGDIKNVWENSRFIWAVELAIHGAAGDRRAIKLLNSRLIHWCINNEPYKGINWKCGQETSIRTLNICLAASVVGKVNVNQELLENFLNVHLKRIYVTSEYALAQKNNHSISEGAALCIGGLMIGQRHNCKLSEKYLNKGIDILNDSVCGLFSEDGCFSQYSANYHRLAIDICMLTLGYSNLYDKVIFHEASTKKLKLAIHWLELMVDKDGNCPNLGANDGSNLFQFLNYSYSDYRPSILFARSILYNIRSNTDSNLSNLISLFCEPNIPEIKLNLSGIINGDNDGIFIYRRNDFLLLFRRPIFKFRPSQSDIFHLDLWVRGKNLLRDAGTFSYYSTQNKSNLYSGTTSHNTVVFDDEDQVPRYSRFLFAPWPKETDFTFKKNGSNIFLSSTFKSFYGNIHKRIVETSQNEVVVNDNISGSFKKAYVNWRLPKSDWIVEDCENENEVIIDFKDYLIKGSVFPFKTNESRLYNSENEIMGIRIYFNATTEIKTIIRY